MNQQLNKSTARLYIWMTQLSNQKSIENGGFYPLFGRKEQSENKLSGYFAENKGYFNPEVLEI